jgi:hypothetical protein
MSIKQGDDMAAVAGDVEERLKMAAYLARVPKSRRSEVVGGKIASLEDALIPVDALGMRWAAWGREKGSTLHPLEAMRMLHDGAVLGGGPTTMPEDIKAWDAVIESDLLEWAHAELLKTWYTRAVPVHVLADRLRISKPTLYKNFGIALACMRTALRTRGMRL